MSQYLTFFLSASGNSSQCDEINHFLRPHDVIPTVENIINSAGTAEFRFLLRIRIFSAIEYCL